MHCRRWIWSENRGKRFALFSTLSISKRGVSGRKTWQPRRLFCSKTLYTHPGWAEAHEQQEKGFTWFSLLSKRQNLPESAHTISLLLDVRNDMTATMGLKVFMLHITVIHITLPSSSQMTFFAIELPFHSSKSRTHRTKKTYISNLTRENWMLRAAFFFFFSPLFKEFLKKNKYICGVYATVSRLGKKKTGCGTWCESESTCSGTFFFFFFFAPRSTQ